MMIALLLLSIFIAVVVNCLILLFLQEITLRGNILLLTNSDVDPDCCFVHWQSYMIHIDCHS